MRPNPVGRAGPQALSAKEKGPPIARRASDRPAALAVT
jgi:hypothetical protein